MDAALPLDFEALLELPLLDGSPRRVHIQGPDLRGDDTVRGWGGRCRGVGDDTAICSEREVGDDAVRGKWVTMQGSA